MLVRPSGVAVAADGTVWIVDAHQGIALHVLADGTIGGMVGGMDGPEGIAIAPDGTVYVAERQAYRVVKLDGSGGTVRVAGDTYLPGFSGDGGLAKKAKLWLPYDVATDAAGNVYIADSANQRVRVIDAATLKIRTIAGKGTSGFSGDDGPALDAQIYGPRAIAVDPGATSVFIADTENMRVRKVDLITNVITTVAGNGAGTVAYSAALTGVQTPLTHLLALAVDAGGNVYIPVFYSDLGLVIMRMDASGTLTRVAGGGNSNVSGVSPLEFALPDVLGLAVDTASGDLLIAATDGRIFRVPEVVPAPVN